MELRPDCPCGSETSYDACCGALHRGARQAATPEELMRSRYAAYAVGDLDHVFRTWHPRTRPAAVTANASLTWTGLDVLASDGDTVEFAADYEVDGRPGTLHEVSRFEVRGGRWLYVDGDVQ